MEVLGPRIAISAGRTRFIKTIWCAARHNFVVGGRCIAKWYVFSERTHGSGGINPKSSCVALILIRNAIKYPVAPDSTSRIYPPIAWQILK